MFIHNYFLYNYYDADYIPNPGGEQDAWSTLRGNSNLPLGDAWEHLHNQRIGDGWYRGLELSYGLEVIMEEACFTVEVDDSAVDVEIDGDLVVEIEVNEYEVERC
jgi:hypothetical protein